jgi:hypothetical protein
MKNEYDQIKKMLNTMRTIKSSSNLIIKEQITPQIGDTSSDESGRESEDEDIVVINNVDVNISSDDVLTAKLTDEEKAKISQMIDDFKTDVSNVVELNQLKIYNNSAKLDGKLSDPPVIFTFSSGDDVGVYLNNISMLKLTEESIETFKKLLLFEDKFITTINDILNSRG